MTKKSLKFQSNIPRPRNSRNRLSYNLHSFKLGDIKVLTDYLNQQTKEIIIKLYRSKNFDPKFFEDKLLIQQNQAKEKYSVLTEVEAIEIIKEISLKEKRQVLQKQRNSYNTYLVRANQREKFIQFKKNANQNSDSKDYKKKLQSILIDQIMKLQKQKVEIERQKFRKQAILRQEIEKMCLKLQKQILVSSIIMIIEKDASQNCLSQATPNLQKVNQVIVVFEQSYPYLHLSKEKLISIIGKKSYQEKIISTLKLYNFSISNLDFHNPTFLTCHDCMKVIKTKNYPQHTLNCLRQVDNHQKNIVSRFAFTPFTYLTKIIRRQFFNQSSQKQIFSHSYTQYHVKSKNNQGYACNRHWCGQCVIKYKHRMMITDCDFCQKVCRCFRCRKFEKIVQLLAHYLEMGGKIYQIQDKFLFNRFFELRQFTETEKQLQIDLSNTKNFQFQPELKKMYDYFIKNSNIVFSEQWAQQEQFQIISGILPKSISQYSCNSLIFHSDQARIKNKKHLANQLQLQRKKFKDLKKMKRKVNIQTRISNLSEQKKRKFEEFQMQQFSILKKKCQKDKIFRSTNPLNDVRLNQKNSDFVIVSQSSFKKKQINIFQMVKIHEANPLKRVHEERRYLRVKRQQEIQKELNIQIERKPRKIQGQFLRRDKIGEKIELEKQKEEILDKEVQNYGSMWE